MVLLSLRLYRVSTVTQNTKQGPKKQKDNRPNSSQPPADLLKGKARKEIQRGFSDRVVVSENLIVDLDSVRHATTSKTNVEHVKEDIHDILCSYYKVARKRFVDNVYHQAVDHCLLTGPMSPLAAFSQEWVIKLEAEQLETIAGESLVTKERRATLVKKIHDMEIAMRILRH